MNKTDMPLAPYDITSDDKVNIGMKTRVVNPFVIGTKLAETMAQCQALGEDSQSIEPTSDAGGEHYLWNTPAIDEFYTGMEFEMKHWDVLVMLAPKIEKIGDVILTDWGSDVLQEAAKWGMILRLGDRAFETDRSKGLPPPYKPGDWVHWRDFHPHSRSFNGVNCLIIPDGSIQGRMRNPLQCKAFYYIQSGLNKIVENKLMVDEEIKYLREKFNEENSNMLKELSESIKSKD